MNSKAHTNLSLIDGLHSTPARRYLSDQQISDDIIWGLIDAAIRGPSGGNSQRWSWIVVRDKKIKIQIAGWYLEGWNKAYGIRRDEILGSRDITDNLGPRNYLSAEHLANNIQDAPVWIFAVLRNTAKSNSPRAGSSIYGAVQNLMLAARSYGIGSTLTTLYSGQENEVKELLGLPEDAMTMALIPLGYPSRGRWAQPKRQKVEDVTHWDHWNALKSR